LEGEEGARSIESFAGRTGAVDSVRVALDVRKRQERVAFHFHNVSIKHVPSADNILLGGNKPVREADGISVHRGIDYVDHS
jgi:hypothetical protein